MERNYYVSEKKNKTDPPTVATYAKGSVQLLVWMDCNYFCQHQSLKTTVFSKLENDQIWCELNHMLFMTTYVFGGYRGSPQGVTHSDVSFCEVQFWALLLF